jgi:O-antigen/teichoic acid export membrane protein
VNAPRRRHAEPDVALGHAIPAGGLGSAIRRGLFWTMGGQWAGYLVQLGTTIVLARLLTPADFGLVGMALTLTVIADQFRSLGLSQAVIQRRDLTWEQVNALFWVNTAAGVVLGLLVGATGGALAAFYGDDRVSRICLVLAFSYVLTGAAVQHNALLSRQLRFRSLALRNGVSRLVASVVAVAAALLGAGYWSLVVLQLAMNCFSLFFVWTAVTWRPSRPAGFRSALPLLGFGAGVSLARLLNAVSRQADNILIGKFIGASALGLYTRAYGLLMLPLRQIKDPLGSIVSPMLSVLQGEPQRYRRLYTSSVAGLAHVGMPAIAVAAVAADPIITVLLGPRWSGAAPLFQLLAVAGFFQLISATTGWLFVSSGRASGYAWWAAVSSVVTVVGFAVGLRWGAKGVAASYAIVQTALVIPSFAVAVKGTSVSLADVLRALVRPIVVATLVLSAAFGTSRWVAPAPRLVQLAFVGAAGLVAWAGVLAVWPAARAELSGLFAMIRPRRPASNDPSPGTPGHRDAGDGGTGPSGQSRPCDEQVSMSCNAARHRRTRGTVTKDKSDSTGLVVRE